MRVSNIVASIGCLAVLLGAVQTAGAADRGSCDAVPPAAFCAAVRGARAEGWPAQSRSEVMARHGMVVTSQPLAAQAGLQILMRGGNAIDAAVATAAVLNVVEPMMVGMGGDLFAVIYVAKEKKIYVLNASGTAPTGATLARFNSLGYRWNPKNWGPTSGMPLERHFAGDRARRGVGLAGSAQTLRQTHVQGGPRTGGSICGARLSGVRTHRARLAAAQRTPAGEVLHGAGPRLDQDVVREWTTAARRGRFSRMPILRKPCACCRRKGRRRSTRVKSRGPSSPSRARSAAA